MKIIKILNIIILTLTFSLMNVSDVKVAKHKGLNVMAKSFFKLASAGHLYNNAHGAATLSQAELVRYLYWLINGAPNNTYPSGMGGPDGGFLGMIRQINGPTALGGGLSTAGYTSCTDIPSTGSAQMVEGGGTYTMTFATPNKTIPTGYTGASGNYDKRVEVNYSDGSTNVDFMEIEFDCASANGWLRFHEPNEQDSDTTSNALYARHIEVYYDTTDSSATKLELYMYREPQTVSSSDEQEYFIAKFETEASNKFKIWVTRDGSDDGAAWSSSRIGVYGSTNLGIAMVNMMFKANKTDTTVGHGNDTGDFTNGDSDCIDFNDGGSAVDGGGACTTASMSSVSSPGAPIIDNTGSFTINWVGNTMKSSMDTL